MRGSRKHRMGKSHTGQELGDDQQEREEPKHRAPPVLQCHVRPRIPWLQGLALPLGPAAAPLCQPPPPPHHGARDTQLDLQHRECPQPALV